MMAAFNGIPEMPELPELPLDFAKRERKREQNRIAQRTYREEPGYLLLHRWLTLSSQLQVKTKRSE